MYDTREEMRSFAQFFMNPPPPISCEKTILIFTRVVKLVCLFHLYYVPGLAARSMNSIVVGLCLASSGRVETSLISVTGLMFVGAKFGGGEGRHWCGVIESITVPCMGARSFVTGQNNAR